VRLQIRTEAKVTDKVGIIQAKREQDKTIKEIELKRSFELMKRWSDCDLSHFELDKISCHFIKKTSSRFFFEKNTIINSSNEFTVSARRVLILFAQEFLVHDIGSIASAVRTIPSTFWF
jgi:hypothetical protein